MTKSYKEIKLTLGTSVESAVNQLLEYRERGELVSVNFNGTILRSDTVTMDDAYQQITGKTKAEFDESLK